MSEPQTVGPGKSITLHFSLRTEDGKEIDSTFEKSAPTFVFGDGNLLPGFEEAMVGLTVGESTHSFMIPPEKGFGAHQPENVQEFDRSVFDKNLELLEGMVISFEDASKAELPGVIKSIGDDKVVVDFNHPLAGRNLIFDVLVLNIEDAETE